MTTKGILQDTPKTNTEISGSSYDATKLSKEDAWIGECDLDEFRQEIVDLGKKLLQQQGHADLAHLQKIMSWSRGCQYIGALTMWYCVNPLSVFLLSLGCMSRWAIIGHHICHGGFDKCSEGRYNRFKFGVGSMWRRVVDWLDWMLVEAWNVEHNQLHHYHLGEIDDPDLVEHNLAFLRVSPMPKPLKYIAVTVMAMIWKWWYYSPNTFKVLTRINKRRAGEPTPPTTKQGKAQAAALESHDAATIHPLWFIPVTLGGEAAPFPLITFFVNVLGPFFVQRFFLPPLLISMMLGAPAGRNALINLVLAEILTNVHSFIIIVTNHAGDDLYRFEHHCKPRSATFFLRQVISSSNFDSRDRHSPPLNLTSGDQLL
mmetsp:Transcript_49326/g.139662  ORF Transcript_49326/g.139662 Transcript_49326/m.139662 type:complete len:372 (-) Transcript_49326:392-1507(-)